MNELIQQLVNALRENPECATSKVSFVATNTDGKYNEYIKDWKGRNSFDVSLKQVEDVLSKEKIKSFNLTIDFEQGIPKWMTESDSVYAKDWFRCSFIFYGAGKVNAVFDMLSSYFGLDQSHFNGFLRKPTEKADVGDEEHGVSIDDKFAEGIQSLLDLKNILIENGNRAITQLEKIKKLNEN